MAAVTDVITLENFASKMPPWAPDLSNHLYALVDMGSNGIRFSISDLSPPHSRLLKCLYRERAAISLFDALNTSSNGPLTFPPEIITQVARTLARFKSIANEYGVPPEHVSVFATEAMRKAGNAASMLDAILAESGLGVYILAPEVETLFGAMGARSAFTEVNGLFLDLGGGSVQITYMNSSINNYEIIAAQAGKSLPFGAAKLIKVLETSAEQARASAINDLQTGMQNAFAKLRQEFPTLEATQRSPETDGVDIYLCGGGFRGYGSILMHNDPIQPYPIPAVGAYTVDAAFFKHTKAMRKVNTTYDGKIFGMSKRRRQQFPAIATVVEALIHSVPRIRTATFCSGGNREGALLMKLPKVIREANPLQLLHQPSNNMAAEVLQSIMDTIRSSLPVDDEFLNVPTIFTWGLGPLFASQIWTRTGEPSDANAAYEIHRAITRDPSAPGFTHLARSLLGLTLCHRWGANLGPVDQQLYTNIRKLVDQANREAVFWAEYIGAIASLLVEVCPTMPNTPARLEKSIQFNAIMSSGKKKGKIELVISLCPVVFQALDPQNIADSFKSVGKQQDTNGRDKKVKVVVQKIPS
ncbi:Ppx/GppA phosphatase [Biscogniauxia marginata]|nr:Ppx/GppA phosphatase [Biscogniauxia marginata]